MACVLRLQDPSAEDRFDELGPEQQRKRVQLLAATVDFLKHSWHMKMPSVIFSVTGSALPLELRPKYLEVFGSGLFNATRNTNAWVVTGGTAVGVMKLVGDSLAKHENMETTVAMATWGALHGRGGLSGRDESALTQQLPRCTVRVDLTGQAPMLRKELLATHFSRFGAVISVTVLREPRPKDSAAEQAYLHKVEKAVSAEGSHMGERVRLASSKSAGFRRDHGGVIWALVSFAEPAAAQLACQKSTVRLQSTTSAPPEAPPQLPAVRAESEAAWSPIDHGDACTEWRGNVRMVRLGLDRDQDSSNNAETRGYELHLKNTLQQRGSIALPFVYKGQREQDESLAGCQLDRNHSHYILIDDGSNAEFGKEVAIRSELLDFISFRHDASTDSIENLTDSIRRRSSERMGLQRLVPVICLVFGGGVNTIATVIEHINTNDPVLIITGSGRAADLIADWVKSCELIAQCHRQGLEPSSARERQASRLRSWLLSQLVCALPETPEEAEELQLKVEGLRETLDKIASYSQLKFFDITDRKEKTSMLNVVLHSIFDSPTITSRIKLPLAIRYNVKSQVKQLMTRQGITRLASDHELTFDARPLIYAAFHDNAEVVWELIDSGFEIAQLDNLILLELHQMCQRESIRAHVKTSRGWRSKAKLKAPRGWVDAQKRQMNFTTSSEQEDWEALGAAEQRTRIEGSWFELSMAQQQRAVETDIMKVNWARLPFVSGWSYRAVIRVRHNSVPRSAEEVVTPGSLLQGDGEDSQEIKVGAILKQRHVTWQSSSSAMVHLVPEGVWSAVRPYECAVINPTQARAFAREAIQRNDLETEEWELDELDWDRFVWLLLHCRDSKQGSVLMQQVIFDEVVGCVELQENSRWSTKMLSKEMWRATLTAFRPWYDATSAEVGVPWWEQHCEADVHEKPCNNNGWAGAGNPGGLYGERLDPLLRLFWAIITGRDALAEVLWSMSSPTASFIGTFLCAYLYRSMPFDVVTIGEPKALKWDKKALDLLCKLEEKAATKQIEIFDEFLYFGTDEEGDLTTYAQLPPVTRRNNASTRAAVSLMGLKTDEPKTRIDLAIMASNKMFMAHPATFEFLATLWKTSSTNGKWFDSKFKWSSPRFKFCSNVMGYLSFILLFAYVFLRFPAQNDMTWPTAFEAILWGWVVAFIANETNQGIEDFDSFQMYLRGSGNTIDFAIMVGFSLSALCRIHSLVQLSLNGDLSGHQLCTSTNACQSYVVMVFLLAMNFLVCGCRLLYMFSVFKSVGVLLIILQKILKEDVLPFMSIMIVVLLGFEIHAYFYVFATVDDGSIAPNDGSFLIGSFSFYIKQWIEYEEYDTGWMTRRDGRRSDFGHTLHQQAGLPVWDRSNDVVRGLHFLFQFIFFIFTLVIMTNLLIAMMSEKFSRVTGAATEEWRVVFAGLVREYWDATVLPLPLNVVEIMLNRGMRSVTNKRMNRYDPKLSSNQSQLVRWGRHYLWPVPKFRFDLKQATAGYHKAFKDGTKQQLKAIQEEIVSTKQSLSVQLGNLAAQPQRHVVAEITDVNAVEIRSDLLAVELGVAAWWRPGKEHSSCVPGTRGDIICESTGSSSVTGERVVALRVHASGRMLLVRRSGIREVEPAARGDGYDFEEQTGPGPQESDGAALGNNSEALIRNGSDLIRPQKRSDSQSSAAKMSSVRVHPIRRPDDMMTQKMQQDLADTKLQVNELKQKLDELLDIARSP